MAKVKRRVRLRKFSTTAVWDYKEKLLSYIALNGNRIVAADGPDRAIVEVEIRLLRTIGRYAPLRATKR